MQRTSGRELSRRLWCRWKDDVVRKEQKFKSQRLKEINTFKGQDII